MIIDDTLRDIIDSLQAELQEAGLVRTRGGMARGKHWAEVAGRLRGEQAGDWLGTPDRTPHRRDWLYLSDYEVRPCDDTED